MNNRPDDRQGLWTGAQHNQRKTLFPQNTLTEDILGVIFFLTDKNIKEKANMKCSITARKWRAIYRLLDRVSPVPYDCGTLCGAACCTCADENSREEAPADDRKYDVAGAAEKNTEIGASTEENGDYQMGIYLYPGEQLIHKRPSDPEEDWLEWSVENSEDYDFPDSWVGPVYFVRCKTPPRCPRKLRPLQCRTFPLKPYLSPEGELELFMYYDELPYSCPLIDKETELDRRFVQATYTVWSHLIRDPLIRDLVEMDSACEDDEWEEWEEFEDLD